MAAYGAELIGCIAPPLTPGSLYFAVQPDLYVTPNPSRHPDISSDETQPLLKTWQSSKLDRNGLRLLVLGQFL